MWEKIKTVEDLRQLKVGDSLAKYPIEGEPKEDIDLNDLFQFQVCSIKNNNFELKFHDNEIEELSNIFGGLTVTGAGGSPAILNKSPQDIIDEGIWWFMK